jgi:hypothetical protein
MTNVSVDLECDDRARARTLFIYPMQIPGRGSDRYFIS